MPESDVVRALNEVRRLFNDRMDLALSAAGHPSTYSDDARVQALNYARESFEDAIGVTCQNEATRMTLAAIELRSYTDAPVQSESYRPDPRD